MRLVCRHPEPTFRTEVGAQVDLPKSAVRTRGTRTATRHRDRPFDVSELRRVLAGEHVRHQPCKQALGGALGIALGALAAPRERDADDEIATRLMPEADRTADDGVEPGKALAVH